MNAYLTPRVTIDVDLMIAREDKVEWFEILEKEGFQLKNDGGNFLQFDPPYGIPWRLDLMIVTHETFATIYGHGKAVQCLGIETKVPKAEHLIAMKIHALRHGPASRISKDLPDVLGLMRSINWNPESPELLALIQKHGVEQIHEAIVNTWNNPK